MCIGQDTYTTGLPEIAVYSKAVQFCQPTISAKITKHRIYAKLVYKVQSAFMRRDCCLRESSCICDFEILSDKVESALSKEAGEVSSP